MAEFKTVGTYEPIRETKFKANGGANYTVDINLPGMLVGKLLHSEVPHALIKSIDTSRAKGIPGVECVICYKHVPKKRWGWSLEDQVTFPWDKVLYVGEPIAAVAAIDEDTAYEALSRIKVDLEELEPVYDVFEAMAPDAPILHPELKEYALCWDWKPDRYGNVCSHTKIWLGEVEQGFKEADEIFEDTYTTPSVHQCYLEPHATVAQMDLNGRFTLHLSTQGTHYTQYRIMQALDIPQSKLRLIAPAVGGAFGGKVEPGTAIYATALAMHANQKPVRLVLDREEEFTNSFPRHPSIITLKTGVKKDMTLTARESRAILDTGAYSDNGVGVCCYSTGFSRGPYRIFNCHAEGLAVYTNKPIRGAFRGFGCPQATWASENQIDRICDEMGWDPLELRLKNAIQTGDIMLTGQAAPSCGFTNTLLAATGNKQTLYPKGHIQSRKEKKLKTKMRGRGLACNEFASGLRGASAVVRLNEDGTLHILAGAVDLGTGCNTMLAQIAAEEFGLPLDRVSICTNADTDATTFDYGSLASRIAHSLGYAVQLATRDAKEKFFRVVCKMLEVDVEDMEIKPGEQWYSDFLEIEGENIFVKRDPKRSLPLKRAVWDTTNFHGGPIMGTGSYLPHVYLYDPEKVKSYMFASYPSLVFSTHVSDVEVDTETGQVKVLNFVCAHDCGTAINMINCEGQIQGGTGIGLGYALTEEIQFDGGRVVNPSIMMHGIPRAVDVPHIHPIIAGQYEPTGPFGAKGVGEPANIASAPALSNAIYDAVGVRIKDLPITPEKILKAIKEKYRK